MYGLIAIVDKTRVGVLASTGAALAAVLAKQAASVGRAYRVSAQPVIFYGPHADLVPVDAWPVVVLDDPDVAGALGYHDLDPNGKPYARVFNAPTVAAGVPLSSVVSHEVCEAVADPYANLWADANRGVAYAFEACDPVENDMYLIDNVGVSNFVTRRWFNPSATVGPFDHMGKLSAPFTMSKGGYLIKMIDGVVSQVFGDDYPAWRRTLRYAAPQPSRSVWRQVRTLVP